jgi:hypothetical protein
MSIQESKGNHYTWRRRCLASMTSSDRADPSAPPSWARAAPAKETGSNTSPAAALKTFCLAWGRACGVRAGCYATSSSCRQRAAAHMIGTRRLSADGRGRRRDRMVPATGRRLRQPGWAMLPVWCTSSLPYSLLPSRSTVQSLMDARF